MNKSVQSPDSAALLPPVPGIAPPGTPKPLLREADPDWVARLARGAGFINFGVFLGFVFNQQLAKEFPPFGPILDLIPDVVFFVGVWMLTAREPCQTNSPFGVRGLTRGACLLSIAFDVLLAAASFVPILAVQPLRGLALILGGVQLLPAGFHVTNLATRIPNASLANQSRFILPAQAIMSVVLGWRLYAESAASIRDSLLRNPVWIPFLIVTFVLLFWYIWIIHRLRKLLAQEAVRARGGPLARF